MYYSICPDSDPVVFTFLLPENRNVNHMLVILTVQAKIFLRPETVSLLGILMTNIKRTKAINALKKILSLELNILFS
jgi:hypothetical protein